MYFFKSVRGVRQDSKNCLPILFAKIEGNRQISVSYNEFCEEKLRKEKEKRVSLIRSIQSGMTGKTRGMFCRFCQRQAKEIGEFPSILWVKNKYPEKGKRFNNQGILSIQSRMTDKARGFFFFSILAAKIKENRAIVVKLVEKHAMRSERFFSQFH